MINVLVSGMSFAFAVVMLPSAMLNPDIEVILPIVFCLFVSVFMIYITDLKEN